MLDDTSTDQSQKRHGRTGRAGRSVQRSGRKGSKQTKARLALIPPEEDWHEWDRHYGVPVLRGEILVGNLVMLAVMRHYRDLQQGHKRGLIFSPAHGQHVIDHIEKDYVHIKGPLALKPLLLDPWQKFWTVVLYGWLNTNGLRRFRRAYERIARKNGKSTWKGPQAGYLCFMDGEAGAEVYAVATTRKQAMTVFAPVFENVKRWGKVSKRVAKSFKVFEGINQEQIKVGLNSIQPLAANPDSQDGFNPSAIMFDELHAQKSREQWDVLESALGSRSQPLLSAITTAGFILDGVCMEIESYLIEILEGKIEDDAFFGYIYALDEGDDIWDEANWLKANPALGAGKYIHNMRDNAKKAKRLPSALANFKTKDLNIWCNSADGWLDMDVWDKGKAKFSVELLKGRRCFGGLDLSSNLDLTAFSLVFPPLEDGGLWYVLVRTWCPRSKVENEADDRAPYKRAEAEGWLEVTEGDVTDYKVIRAAVIEANQQFKLEMVGFDRWNATEVVSDLMDADINMLEIPQNTQGMYPGSKLLEELVYDKRWRHGGNTIFRYCANNVALLYDTNGNFRPDKKNAKNKGRIDCMVATVIALSTYKLMPEESTPGIG